MFCTHFKLSLESAVLLLNLAVVLCVDAVPEAFSQPAHSGLPRAKPIVLKQGLRQANDGFSDSGATSPAVFALLVIFFY